jgi:hypothetical protein
MALKTSPANNIKIYSKLRPPLQQELYGSQQNLAQGTHEKNKKSTSGHKSANNLITYPKASSLAQDFPYSFYSNDNENNKQLVYLKNPIKGKLLEKTFKNATDTTNYQDLCHDVSATFTLERAFGQGVK